MRNTLCPLSSAATLKNCKKHIVRGAILIFFLMFDCRCGWFTYDERARLCYLKGTRYLVLLLWMMIDDTLKEQSVVVAVFDVVVDNYVVVVLVVVVVIAAVYGVLHTTREQGRV